MIRKIVSWNSNRIGFQLKIVGLCCWRRWPESTVAALIKLNIRHRRNKSLWHPLVVYIFVVCLIGATFCRLVPWFSYVIQVDNYVTIFSHWFGCAEKVANMIKMLFS